MRVAYGVLLAGLAALPPALALQDGAEDGEPAPAFDVELFDAELVGRVHAVLTPPASGDEPDPDAMSAALAKLGDRALPVVVAALTGELEIPPTAWNGLDESVHPVALAAREKVLRTSLKRFSPRAVVAHLGERATGDAPMDMKLFAAGILGEIDDARAMGTLLDISTSIEPIHLLRGYVQVTLEGSLARQLEARPDSRAEIERSARAAGAELTCVFARAIGRVRSAQGIEFLARQLGRHEQADAVIVEQIGLLAGDGGLAVEPGALAELRRLVGSTDLQVQRAAATALGRLRDGGSISALTGLLESPDARVRGAAHWSLCIVAATDLGQEPDPWLAWQESEEAWWLEEGPDLLEALRSDQPGEAFEAISLLVQHPLQRHDTAEALGPLLVHPDAGVARAACAAVAQLGSSRSLDWLVAALASDDRLVRTEAQLALSRLTGLSLPAEYTAWAQAIKG